MFEIITSTSVPVADPARRLNMGLAAFSDDRLILSLESGADMRATMHCSSQEAASFAYAILDAIEQIDAQPLSLVA